MGLNEIMHRLAITADLYDEPMPGLPVIEILDHKRVLIENHCGVTEYENDMIRVRVKFGQICVEGTSLKLAKMSKGQLVISGCIDAVRLFRGC